jgi:hypothetical protein
MVETLSNIGIKVSPLVILLFVLCSASVNAIQAVFSKSSYERTYCKMGRLVGFSNKTDLLVRV